MKSIQKEHAGWIARKYPDQPAKIPAVGCLEEAGELVHGILKTEQVQRWGADSRHNLADLRVKIVDAIGDCGIYACSLCNAVGWDFEGEWDLAKMANLEVNDALNGAIILVQKACDLAIHPYNIMALGVYLQQLIAVAKCLGLDAEIAIVRTWQIVRER